MIRISKFKTYTIVDLFLHPWQWLKLVIINQISIYRLIFLVRESLLEYRLVFIQTFSFRFLISFILDLFDEYFALECSGYLLLKLVCSRMAWLCFVVLGTGFWFQRYRKFKFMCYKLYSLLKQLFLIKVARHLPIYFIFIFIHHMIVHYKWFRLLAFFEFILNHSISPLLEMLFAFIYFTAGYLNLYNPSPSYISNIVICYRSLVNLTSLLFSFISKDSKLFIMINLELSPKNSQFSRVFPLNWHEIIIDKLTNYWLLIHFFLWCWFGDIHHPVFKSQYLKTFSLLYQLQK